jgi:hypothetical protein
MSLDSKALKAAVDKKRREISSDNLSMSIGEMLNLYKDGELDIHPEFQRVFRWLPEQKSRLIESLLLGIPLPPIYVATNERGVWEVIDGVQRLSTIFEFVGELKGPSSEDSEALDSLLPEIELSATKHLPELAGARYSEIDQTLRLELKRTRLDVKVLSREGGKGQSGKFDLFERLNTYGQPLSPQELRNCVLVSINANMFRWLKNLAADEHFVSATMLSETQLLERYDMDLALRFIVLREASDVGVGDIHEFLRDRMEEIALDSSFDFAGEERRFRDVFRTLDEAVGSDSFRPWNPVRGAFRGGFSLAGFEGISLMLARRWDEVWRLGNRFDFSVFIKEVWTQPEYTKSFSGLRARERMARVMPAVERVLQARLAAGAADVGPKAKPVGPAHPRKAAAKRAR